MAKRIAASAGYSSPVRDEAKEATRSRILEALGRYQQGQVLGYYNSQNEELVYTGDERLSRIEQFILAHELTHLARRDCAWNLAARA